MPPLSSSARASLPNSAFAYIDSRGRRLLPIHDESHVRNALARFSRTIFESENARERARKRLLNAAKRYGIVPVGFIDGQIRNEREDAEIRVRNGEVSHLPTGEVTFLFTDIEGSTALVRRLGDRYGDLLDKVRRAVRAAVRKAGGQEVDTRADEFFGAFASPDAAVQAGIDIQRTLARSSRRNGAAVRLRIGVHTGRPTLTKTGYIGVAVHTAARICAAAKGGQVLVSAATRAALGESALPGVVFEGLGLHRLPGLPEPESLYAVDARERTAAPGRATPEPAAELLPGEASPV
jgi:class 3 adenylate cyclase